MAEAIIERALLLVAQDGVGLGTLLEFFLGLGVVGIPVGMVEQREFAIRALDFLFRRRA